MLTIHNISEILDRAAALPVHQVAILAFLNRVRSAEEIAGHTGAKTSPVKDDPRRFTGGRAGGKGYDIGIKVAQRILDRRKELGGKFSSLNQLAGIAYFGEDKFHDLVYTFLHVNSPIPSGLGDEFDEYLTAIGVLELSQLEQGQEHDVAVSAIRKLNLDNEARSGSSAQLNWDDVIPGAEGVTLPESWGDVDAQKRSMDTVKRLTDIKVKQDPLNVPVLLAGLDARNHPGSVRSGALRVEIRSNMQFSTFLHGISTGVYEYFLTHKAGEGRMDAEGILLSYIEAFPAGALVASADAYAMEYDRNRSLSWNLLNYYGDRGGAIKRRFVNFSRELGLGEWKEGVFSGDTARLREGLIEQAVNGAMKILEGNNGGQEAGDIIAGGANDSRYADYQFVAGQMVDQFIEGMNFRVSLELFQPAILSWNRLEARPRTKNFGRALRAEVRDPLWFLSRQWQIGEFEGEDTGSSVEMRIDMETVPVNRYSLRKGTARPYDGTVPMEAIVEREMVDFDLTLSQEMGRQWEKFVRRRLAAASYSTLAIKNMIADFKDNPTLQFSLPTPPEDHPDIYSDYSLVSLYSAIGGGRMLNGGALYNLLKGGTTPVSLLNSTTSPPAGVLNNAKDDFLDWFSEVYNQPVSPADDAWAPSQLEYQFQCSAPKTGSSRTVLTADEYAHGRLDWYSFDIETNNSKSDPSLRSIGSDSNLIERRVSTVLPGDLRFPGMPMARWWEFEDWKVNLGSIVADTTDVPRLLQAEFALIYSNDWMLLPHDVKVGSICNVKSIIVKDVFGQYTQVKAAGAGDNTDWQRWTMYNLNRRGLTSGPADTRLFVPPAVIKTMESEALEEVTFLRDEMANMVWGIESTIPDGRGGGRDGTEAATALYKFLVGIAPAPPLSSPPVPNEAEIEYQLGTSVPENWIPFIPVRLGGVNSHEIQLRRAAMPRLIPGQTPERVRPRTDLLKEGFVSPNWGPYYIFEEEIPRSGAIVKRNWQRVRGMDGAVYTWLGRHKQNGRGEVNSGLEYDIIKDR